MAHCPGLAWPTPFYCTPRPHGRHLFARYRLLPAARRSWADTFRVYTGPASLRMLALGFSAGLPLLRCWAPCRFWLRKARHRPQHHRL
ncbi:hypothetical protein ACFODQ_02830, partial [Comamonas sp. JC664]